MLLWALHCGFALTCLPLRPCCPQSVCDGDAAPVFFSDVADVVCSYSWDFAAK